MSTAADKRSYRWFVEPLDAMTNEVLSRELSPDDTRRDEMCADGQRHDLWECPYSKLKYLKRSRSWAKIRFHEWRQRGRGQIESWPPKKAG